MNSNALAGNKNSGIREEKDFYATPEYATEALLEKEDFGRLVWEPACGDGAISKVLSSKNFIVMSSDIVDRGYPGTVVSDFFHQKPDHTPNIIGWKRGKIDAIITNPPYKLAQEFIEESLENTKAQKVAMLLKLNFLEGQKRKRFFQKHPPKNIYVFSKRLTFYEPNSDKKGKSGVLAYAWYVWEKGFNGYPTIDWI